MNKSKFFLVIISSTQSGGSIFLNKIYSDSFESYYTWSFSHITQLSHSLKLDNFLPLSLPKYIHICISYSFFFSVLIELCNFSASIYFTYWWFLFKKRKEKKGNGLTSEYKPSFVLHPFVDSFKANLYKRLFY